jgi:2-keto-4-pentenoate hydratase/2-oxohepta-3-ene-1,7-dioic acid hydratase in catechol pathway
VLEVEVDGSMLHVRQSPGGREAGGSRRSLPQGDAHLLAPVEPSKVLVVLGGFPFQRSRADARAQKLPFSTKLSSAIIGPGDTICIPDDAPYPVVAEVELGVVIAHRCRRVSPDEAAAAILGYLCVNDVCMLELGLADHDFVRAKSLDTFCPLGPWINSDITEADIAAGLGMRTLINGEIRQEGNTGEYTYLPSEIISQASQYFTLEAGDVISFGTPPGQQPITPGDTVTIEIDQVGTLTNPVARGPAITV